MGTLPSARTTSFLVDPPTLERLLEAAGFTVLERRDRRAETLAWFEARAAAAAASGPAPTGIHLLLGPLFAPAFANLVAGLREVALVPMLVRAVRR